MTDLTRGELAYLRRRAEPGGFNFADSSHWNDPTFQKLRKAGLVVWVKPSRRTRQVEITDAGRAALAGA